MVLDHTTSIQRICGSCLFSIADFTTRPIKLPIEPEVTALLMFLHKTDLIKRETEIIIFSF